MNFSRVLLTSLSAVALLGASALVGTGANAQTPTTGDTQGTTTGTAGGGQTGNASVLNIADLKSPLHVADYDDDPGGQPGSPYFYVTPNLDDAPLQTANKYIFVNNPSGIAQLQVTIRATPNGTVIYDELLPGANILSGSACLALVGTSDTVGSVAHGLVSTGQKSAQEIIDIRNGCVQNTVGVIVDNFPVSKHLPPGVYDQCVALSLTGGGAVPRVCVPIRINAITGYVTDAGAIDFGTLVQNVKSIDQGDFIPGNTNGTIMGVGNTSPILTVRYSWMQNTTFDPGTDKYITRWFDVQINRRDTAGNIIAFQHIDNLLGGADPDSPNPFAGADAAVLTELCLEPNEPLKLDFSVTPQEVLYPGQYTGLVRLSVADSGGTACTPTLGAGESASGDTDNNPFNNLPGTPVGQNFPTPQ
jgi:hypothetical protein